IASLFTPFSLVTIWFLPLPFFLYTVRHSWPSALFPAAVLGALALILLHPLWIFGVLFAAAAGMALGAVDLSTAVSGPEVVRAGLVVGAAVLLLALAAAQYGFGLLADFQRLRQEQWDLLAATVQNSVPEASVPPLPALSAVLPLF